MTVEHITMNREQQNVVRTQEGGDTPVCERTFFGGWWGMEGMPFSLCLYCFPKYARCIICKKDENIIKASLRAKSGLLSSSYGDEEKYFFLVRKVSNLYRLRATQNVMIWGSIVHTLLSL